MELMAVQCEFVALHISDIHFGDFYQFLTKESLSREVSRAIEKLRNNDHIRGELRGELVHPKYLFCTGDLTSKGKSEPFAEAQAFLEAVAKELEIPNGNIICCPGNHDFSEPAAEIYRNEHGNSHKQILHNYGVDHFKGYLEVVAGLNRFDQPHGWARKVPKFEDLGTPSEIFSIHYYAEHDLLVYSVNSVVLHTSERSEQFGYVGEPQLQKIDDCIKDYQGPYQNLIANPAFRLVLVHHPPRFGYDLDRSSICDQNFENWLRRHEVDLVLHGHQHYSGIRVITDSPPKHTKTYIGAGSLGSNDAQRADNHVSLNFIKVKYRGRGTKSVVLVPGEFHTRTGDWEYRASEIQSQNLDPHDKSVREFAEQRCVATALDRAVRTLDDIASGSVVRLEGSKSALSSYIEAFGRTESLRVTSRLDSFFWSGDSSEDVMEAHRGLLRRGATLKRIFVTHMHYREYAKTKVELAFARHMAGYHDEWERLFTGVDNLNLLADRFHLEMYVLEAKYYKRLGQNIYDPANNKQELALYQFESAQEFRCDVFDIGEGGQIEGVTIRDFQNFDRDTYDRIVEEFDLSWNAEQRVSIKQYTALVKQEMRNVQDPARYKPNELLRFETLVENRDPTLVDEMETVIPFLKVMVKRQPRNKFQRAAEIGVFNGRWSRKLQEEKLVSRLTACDMSGDVQTYIKRNMPGLKFVLGDIRDHKTAHKLGGPFNLIICMLGSVCHFDLDSQRGRWNGVSGFAMGIANMVSLLALNGILVFSAWRRGDNPLIDIYSDFERRRLLDNAPTSIELEAALTYVESHLNVQCRYVDLGSTQRLNLFSIERIT